MKIRDSVPDDYEEGVAYCDECAEKINNGEKYLICEKCEEDVCIKCASDKFFIEFNESKSSDEDSEEEVSENIRVENVARKRR